LDWGTPIDWSLCGSSVEYILTAENQITVTPYPGLELVILKNVKKVHGYSDGFMDIELLTSDSLNENSVGFLGKQLSLQIILYTQGIHLYF